MTEKLNLEELKNYLKIRGLKVTGMKKELVARVFKAQENDVEPVKTEGEVEAVLRNEYSKKLVVDDGKIPYPFKIPHGWQTGEEGMAFWPMILFPDIFSYLAFNPSELGSNVLSDYKNCKIYSYHMSGWLQWLMDRNLAGGKCYIFKGECRHSQSMNNLFHKFCLIVEETGKICAFHCMFRVEVAVRNGLTSASCTSSLNE